MNTSPEAATGLPLWALASITILVLTVVILSFAMTRLVRRGSKAADAAPTARPVEGPIEAGPGRGPEPLSSQGYTVLLHAFIGTYDLSSSEIVRAHVLKSLRAVGIAPITPAPGDPFDVGLHNGVAGIPAPSPGLVFRIARVLRPGWRSDDGVLRMADVEVYKDGTT
ncbi:nucleotide exchange factor GrpE [Arthrobacter globiformis]|uniref:nucleotide exchange factor GrpE n=1 Tax=Arthrobacter globiformis TaxID=1665 RepID=UPI00278CE935|nr:nucleotide exchange factor GrpE [Arthrobacter globiformis]MDQ0616762.1 hypothetical protein [Arthrobacter globiformis]